MLSSQHSLSVQGSFLQLLFVSGCLLCLLQSVFVWERGGGAPVCVGFINLEHSSKEMLSKLGGVNINPSLPCFTDSASLHPHSLCEKCCAVMKLLAV